MSEKLLVCDALDERDFLRKKIMSNIKDATFVSYKRKKDTLIDGRYTVEEVTEGIKSNFQKVQDMIKRYQNIDIALTLSNATVMIVTKSGETMTRASAIALRKSLLNRSDKDTDFTGLLIRTMKNQFNTVALRVKECESAAEKQADVLRASFVGKDTQKKISDEEIKIIESMTANFYADYIDPISVESKISDLSEKYTSLIREIETAIKVSNATTYVEIN